jgi:outer membrane protein OmpA-like peptidoglycan-associated protein
MKIFCNIFVIIYLVSIISSNLYGNNQEKPIFYYGIGGGLGLNLHIADFNKLEGIPSCCPKYTTATGLGWNLSIFGRKEIIEKGDVSVRLGFSYEGAQFVENEFIGNTSVKYVSNLSQIVIKPAYVDHYLQSKIYSLFVEPSASYLLFERFWISLGLNISNLVLTKANQYEELTSPDSVVFIDGKTTRNSYSDLDIPKPNIWQIRPSLGASYDFNFLGNGKISPEIHFLFPFQNISNVSWKILQITLGVSVRFPVYPPPEIRYYYDTTYVRDTTVVAVLGLKETRVSMVEPPHSKTEQFEVEDGYLLKTTINESYRKEIPKLTRLDVGLKAVGKSRDGQIQDNPTLVIEEIETEEMFPLLPYVFFPEGVGDLAKTSLEIFSKDKISKFDESKLPWNTLEIYSNLLNIIGKRLKENPGSKITIVGCNSGQGAEAKGLELSKQRATSVRNYFVDVWGIDANRIQIKTQNLPDKPSNPAIPEGVEENQRAEIYSNNIEILRPVKLSEIQRTSNPPIVELFPTVESEAPVKSWNLNIEQGGQVLRSFAGVDIPDKVIWKVEEEPIPRLEQPVQFNLSAIDVVDQKQSATMSLNIEQKTIRKKREELLGDRKIERFSLILFDFDKAEISPKQKPLLEEIRKKIKPNSKVIIAGFTDKIGEEEYNKDLALRRCLETKKFLGVPDSQIILNPVGSEYLLYDNSTPQGRSYCRTVQITIETPIR